MTFRPCVVVPVFNHGASAVVLAKELVKLGVRSFLVNDGSDTECRALLHGLALDHDLIDVLDHDRNQGKGAAVLTGLRAAFACGHTHAVQIDADGQHDAGDIPKFLALAETNPQAVVAGCPQFDTTVPKGRFLARYLTHVWIWVETLSFSIRDSMCGFRVYPLATVVPLADRVRLGRRMDFDPEVLVRLYWEGTEILPVPTNVTYPADGKSHFLLWRDNGLISWMHTRLVFGMLWRVASGRFRRSGADRRTP